MSGTVLTAVALAMLSQACGINVIIYYGSLVFVGTLGQPAQAALGATLLIGLVSLAFTLIALALIDRAGRRPLLLVSKVGMGSAQLVLAAAFAAHAAPALIIGAVLAGIASFAVGFGPCPWLLLTEMFPNRLRGRAMSLATMLPWLASFGVTVSFFKVRAALGMPATFCLYALACFAAAWLTWSRIPEMRGEQLEQARSHALGGTRA